jgi:serine/threonine protein kinase
MDFEHVSERYTLLQELGQGGFSTVYLALDTILDRHVALKVLKLPKEGADELTKRFLVEAKIASRLNHPNTVSVYDFGTTNDGQHFIVTEFLEGESLFEYLHEGPAPLDLALQIMHQAILALQKAHDLDIIHRDVKPANIYLVHPMKGPTFVKLLDFGIAKMKETQSHTMTGQMLGTPRYMSPEQIINIKLVDYRSDIYSLGIVFFQLLSGVIPFDDPSYYVVMRHHMQKPLPPLKVPYVPKEIVDQLEELIQKMTLKDVSKRLDSLQVTQDFISHLQTQFPDWAGLDASSTNESLQKVRSSTYATPVSTANSALDHTHSQESQHSTPIFKNQPSIAFELDEDEKNYLHSSIDEDPTPLADEDYMRRMSSTEMKSTPERPLQVLASPITPHIDNTLPNSEQKALHRKPFSQSNTSKAKKTLIHGEQNHQKTEAAYELINATPTPALAGYKLINHHTESKSPSPFLYNTSLVDIPNSSMVQSISPSEAQSDALTNISKIKHIEVAYTHDQTSTAIPTVSSLSSASIKVTTTEVVNTTEAVHTIEAVKSADKRSHHKPTRQSIADHGVSANEMGFHVTRSFPKNNNHTASKRSAQSLDELMEKSAKNSESGDIQSFEMPFDENAYGMNFSFRETFLLQPPAKSKGQSLSQIDLIKSSLHKNKTQILQVYILNPSEFVANLYAQGIRKATQSSHRQFQNRVEVKLYQKLEQLIEGIDKQIPQLLLIELNISVNLGLTYIEQLRKKYDQPIAMIAISSDAKSKESALMAGANDFLPKPVQQQELIHIVFEYLKHL